MVWGEKSEDEVPKLMSSYFADSSGHKTSRFKQKQWFSQNGRLISLIAIAHDGLNPISKNDQLDI
jgi:hypothetical protein